MDKGQEGMCDTGLVLGLSYKGSSSSPPAPADRHRRRDPGRKLEPSSSTSAAALEPSLTLGLPINTYGSTATPATAVDGSKGCVDDRAAAQQSPRQSTVSSFSNSHPAFLKRENDTRSDETERVSSRVSDEEEEGSVRKKLRLTKEQSALLEDKFKEQSTLNPKQKITLAKQLNLRPRQVEVWFQNRRARTKLKQTEVDCEYLKRCCESLTDENRRLQKELHELKALKFAATPLFMQLPGAAFTMCPSCEKITPATEGSKSSPFVVVPPKPHLFNPYTHSAAC